MGTKYLLLKEDFSYGLVTTNEEHYNHFKNMMPSNHHINDIRELMSFLGTIEFKDLILLDMRNPNNQITVRNKRICYDITYIDILAYFYKELGFEYNSTTPIMATRLFENTFITQITPETYFLSVGFELK